jgi:hypothetical protein
MSNAKATSMPQAVALIQGAIVGRKLASLHGWKIGDQIPLRRLPLRGAAGRRRD